MKRSSSKSSPARKDFAVEEFGGEALILRLADMRLFRVNKQALELFEVFLESNCDASAALGTAKEHKMDLDSKGIESIQKIIFQPDNDQEEHQL